MSERNILSTWGWRRPTLAIVDYAAMSGSTLKDWLAALADHPAAKDPGTQPPLRILLLERHANQENGWYYELADSTRHGERARKLLAPRAPRNIAAIDPRASAHLDSEFEAAIQRALERALAGRTSIVIAHRLSIILKADTILVVQIGHIVQRGRHATLWAQPGIYTELYQRQSAETTGR